MIAYMIFNPLNLKALYKISFWNFSFFFNQQKSNNQIVFKVIKLITSKRNLELKCHFLQCLMNKVVNT